MDIALIESVMSMLRVLVLILVLLPLELNALQESSESTLEALVCQNCDETSVSHLSEMALNNTQDSFDLVCKDIPPEKRRQVDQPLTLEDRMDLFACGEVWVEGVGQKLKRQNEKGLLQTWAESWMTTLFGLYKVSKATRETAKQLVTNSPAKLSKEALQRLDEIHDYINCLNKEERKKITCEMMASWLAFGVAGKLMRPTFSATPTFRQTVAESERHTLQISGSALKQKVKNLKLKVQKATRLHTLVMPSTIYLKSTTTAKTALNGNLKPYSVLADLRYRMSYVNALKEASQKVGISVAIKKLSNEALTLLSRGATAKPAYIKAKSAPSGPLKGFVPANQKYSGVQDPQKLAKLQANADYNLARKRAVALPFVDKGKTLVERRGRLVWTKNIQKGDEVVKVLSNTRKSPFVSDPDIETTTRLSTQVAEAMKGAGKKHPTINLALGHTRGQRTDVRFYRAFSEAFTEKTGGRYTPPIRHGMASNRPYAKGEPVDIGQNLMVITKDGEGYLVQTADDLIRSGSVAKDGLIRHSRWPVID